MKGDWAAIFGRTHKNIQKYMCVKIRLLQQGLVGFICSSVVQYDSLKYWAKPYTMGLSNSLIEAWHRLSCSRCQVKLSLSSNKF